MFTSVSNFAIPNDRQCLHSQISQMVSQDGHAFFVLPRIWKGFKGDPSRHGLNAVLRTASVLNENGQFCRRMPAGFTPTVPAEFVANPSCLMRPEPKQHWLVDPSCAPHVIVQWSADAASPSQRPQFSLPNQSKLLVNTHQGPAPVAVHASDLRGRTLVERWFMASHPTARNTKPMCPFDWSFLAGTLQACQGRDNLNFWIQALQTVLGSPLAQWSVPGRLLESLSMVDFSMAPRQPGHRQIIVAGQGTTATTFIFKKLCEMFPKAKGAHFRVGLQSNLEQEQASILSVIRNHYLQAVFCGAGGRKCPSPSGPKFANEMEVLLRASQLGSWLDIAADTPFPQFFDVLWKQNPEALVVLTVRNSTAWAKSRIEHHGQTTFVCVHNKAVYLLFHPCLEQFVESTPLRNIFVSTSSVGTAALAEAFDVFNDWVIQLVPDKQLVVVDVFGDSKYPSAVGPDDWVEAVAKKRKQLPGGWDAHWAGFL